MPCAIVVGSRPQPRGCLQGLQPSRHPHVHLNPPVLHCMATTFSVTPAQLKKKARRVSAARRGGEAVCVPRPVRGPPCSAWQSRVQERPGKSAVVAAAVRCVDLRPRRTPHRPFFSLGVFTL
jgi:hypothetical protein